MTTDREVLAELARRLPAVVEKLRDAYKPSGWDGLSMLNSRLLEEATDELAQITQIAVLAADETTIGGTSE